MVSGGEAQPHYNHHPWTTTLHGGYHDYANAPGSDGELDMVMNQSRVKGTDQPFPVKLHSLLSDASDDGFAHIVSWQPHGRSFLVRQHKEFVETVLPRCFRQSKFPSFQRQLNLYGFKRITTGRDKGSYYHEKFLRGKPVLVLTIQRTKVKGTGTRRPSKPESEPNFYAMPYLPNDNYSFTNPRPPKQVLSKPPSMGTGTRRPSKPESEPNFYVMPYLPNDNYSFTNPRPPKQVLSKPPLMVVGREHPAPRFSSPHANDMGLAAQSYPPPLMDVPPTTTTNSLQQLLLSGLAAHHGINGVNLTAILQNLQHGYSGNNPNNILGMAHNSCSCLIPAM